MFFLAAQTASTSGGAGSWFSLIIMYGLIFAVFWFLLIRPQRKRQKQVVEMQKNVNVGDWVMTTGGLFGKIVDTVNEYLIIEFGTNKSVLIPMQRDQVATIKEPDLTRKKYEKVEEDVEDVEDEEDEDDDEE